MYHESPRNPAIYPGFQKAENSCGRIIKTSLTRNDLPMPFSPLMETIHHGNQQIINTVYQRFELRISANDWGGKTEGLPRKESVEHVLPADRK